MIQNQIANKIRSAHSALQVISHEEQRVESAFKAIAKKVGFSLFAWSATTGFIKFNLETDQASPHEDERDPLTMLDKFIALPEKSILLARDLQMLLDPKTEHNNPVLVRRLKDVFLIGKETSRVFVIVGCQLRLPPELEKEITVLDFPLPTRDEIHAVFKDISQSASLPLPAEIEPLLDAGCGMTLIEVGDAAALSAVESGAILPMIIRREKINNCKKGGMLEIIEPKITLEQIGGWNARKEWLMRRKRAFTREAKDYGLPTPKGEFVFGVPGCGKSLGAEATALTLDCPLIRWRFADMFDSLVGNTERNMKQCIEKLEAMSPVVVHIDEFEKAFAGGKSSGSDGGGQVTQHVTGMFLEWSQEKTSAVYLYATANNITNLPEAILRKGRWDELWFVDLPDEDEREAIWAIQIAKYGRKPEEFDLHKLALATNGFTGAEIESAFCDALYVAFDKGREPGELDIALITSQTVPLSKTMGTELDALRTWAKGRARAATAPKTIRQGSRKLTK